MLSSHYSLTQTTYIIHIQHNTYKSIRVVACRYTCILIQFTSNNTHHHTEGLIPYVGVWNLERHDVGCDFGCSHNKSTGTLDVGTEWQRDRSLYSPRLSRLKGTWKQSSVTARTNLDDSAEVICIHFNMQI